jgi:hypothetical protein
VKSRLPLDRSGGSITLVSRVGGMSLAGVERLSVVELKEEDPQGFGIIPSENPAKGD